MMSYQRKMRHLLAVAAAGMVVLFLAQRAASASTGFRYKGTIDEASIMESGVGMALANGKVYTLSKDVVTLNFGASDVLDSPLRVAAGSTAVIFLAKGQTLS